MTDNLLCPNCNGTGEFPEHTTCQCCHGEGHVVEEVEVIEPSDLMEEQRWDGDAV